MTSDISYLTLLVVGRVIERLIIAFFAGMSLYLGYRLFALNATEVGSAVLKRGDLALKLTNIGQGVFFALFGATVLGLGLYRPLSTGELPPVDPTNKCPPSISYYAPIPPASMDDVLQAITTLDRFLKPVSERLPEDGDAEKAGRAISILLAIRPSIIDSKFGKGVFESYTIAKSLKQNPTAFEAELRRSGMGLQYDQIETLLSRSVQ